ncbi:hypothetical protein PZC41_14190 [Staphylococcus aureus]|uniref:hypothetical protein n=1 Tax=Staphylococcus aureus TaxID=1280 RepID=UPI0023AF7B46|nr:hypothetical protein [Staphylococcus aureus]MDE8535454.1 hypothetical protein [Staphylococcus aureus]
MNQKFIAQVRQAVRYYAAGYQSAALTIKALFMLHAKNEGWNTDIQKWSDEQRVTMREYLEREAKAAGMPESDVLLARVFE